MGTATAICAEDPSVLVTVAFQGAEGRCQGVARPFGSVGRRGGLRTPVSAELG